MDLSLWWTSNGLLILPKPCISTMLPIHIRQVDRISNPRDSASSDLDLVLVILSIREARSNEQPGCRVLRQVDVIRNLFLTKNFHKLLHNTLTRLVGSDTPPLYDQCIDKQNTLAEPIQRRQNDRTYALRETDKNRLGECPTRINLNHDTDERHLRWAMTFSMWIITPMTLTIFIMLVPQLKGELRELHPKRMDARRSLSKKMVEDHFLMMTCRLSNIYSPLRDTVSRSNSMAKCTKRSHSPEKTSTLSEGVQTRQTKAAMT